jgi:hypothetical protein
VREFLCQFLAVLDDGAEAIQVEDAMEEGGHQASLLLLREPEVASPLYVGELVVD